MSDAFVLILAGGGGTRLWPASRRGRPKQLLALGGPEPLLAATFRRASAIVGADRTLIVTAADQADAVRATLPALPDGNLVVEPAARNTAAAVGLGAAAVARRGGRDARFAVLPSDHHIADEAAFVSCAQLALAHATRSIVTIGIRPTHPETGFGYLRLGGERAPGVFDVAAFVEKPDSAKAAALVAEGCVWNAGMFFLSAGRMLDEARAHLPPLGAILDELVVASDFEATAAARYPAAPAVSIDFGVMEKTSGILAVPGAFGWNDVGSWDAVASIRPGDADGNVVSGDAVVLGAHRSLVVSDPGAPLVAVSDVDDVVVIATRDAVLVTRRSSSQGVRAIVEELARKRRTDLL